MRRRPSSGRLERRGIRAFQSYVSSPAALAIATLVGDVVLVGMPSCFMPDLGGACSLGRAVLVAWLVSPPTKGYALNRVRPLRGRVFKGTTLAPILTLPISFLSNAFRRLGGIPRRALLRTPRANHRLSPRENSHRPCNLNFN